ncbi:hypothetical protein [Marinactinospora rubrisoli]|uniref:Oxidoreductase n=1 Tax=Marinactinospora rubrisoli TaxID=2715399 RepID=A0ABW2KNJ8_9ACTN
MIGSLFKGLGKNAARGIAGEAGDEFFGTFVDGPLNTVADGLGAVPGVGEWAEGGFRVLAEVPDGETVHDMGWFGVGTTRRLDTSQLDGRFGMDERPDRANESGEEAGATDTHGRIDGVLERLDRLPGLEGVNGLAGQLAPVLDGAVSLLSALGADSRAESSWPGPDTAQHALDVTRAA